MNIKLQARIFLLLLSLASYATQAQRFPVAATIQILPPYTPYLSDYISPGEDRIRITLVLLDQREPSVQVKLRLQVQGQGYSFSSDPKSAFTPLTLQANVPLTLTNADLRPYITAGASVIQSIRRRPNQSKLQEGLYQFCIEVYPYVRDETPISDKACTQAFLQELDPPLIVAPISEVSPTTPQALLFAWHMQHFGGFPVDYELSYMKKQLISVIRLSYRQK